MPIDTTTTNLEGVDFSQRTDKAALRGQSLAFHRCKRVNFGTLDLTGTNFSGAELQEATFEGATLDKANFTNAIVTLDQIEQGKSYAGAIAPNGVVIESMEQIREEYAKGSPESVADQETRLKLAAEREADLMKRLADLEARFKAQESAIEAARESDRLKPQEQQANLTKQRPR